MALTVGCILPCQCECAQVSQDQRVHTCRIQAFQMRRQTVCLPVARHGIDRHMDLHAVIVRKAHGLRQFLIAEIAGKGAHTEGCSGQIHGIRAVQNSHFQFFHVPRRRQQFGLLSCHVSRSHAVHSYGLPGSLKIHDGWVCRTRRLHPKHRNNSLSSPGSVRL